MFGSICSMAFIWQLYMQSVSLVGLSDSENNTIIIVKIVVLTIMNTIIIIGYQFINNMIINKKA